MQQPGDKVCVIVCEPGGLAGALAPHAFEGAGGGVEEVCFHEGGGFDSVLAAHLRDGGGFGVEDASGAGQGGDRETVPGGDDFIVEVRARAFRVAVCEEFRAGGGDDAVDFLHGETMHPRELLGGVCDTEDVLVDEFIVRVVFGVDVSVAVDVPVFCAYAGVGGGEDGVELTACPDVEGALALVGVGAAVKGVGTFGGVEAAGGVGEGGGAEVGCGGDGGGKEERGARDEPGVKVDGEELGVVVEHLFEVGKGPVRRDGVPVETVPDLVVDAASGHVL